MSFNDLNSGTPLPLYRNEAADGEFDALAKRVGIQIFKINSNVTAITKLVSLRTAGQGQDWTKRIHDLTETTRELVKDGSADIKRLAAFTLPSGATASAKRLTQGKLQREFQAAAVAFQRAQKDSAQRTRQALEGDRASLAQSPTHELPPSQPQQAQLQAQPISQTELEYQESLIASREAEIREIESGVQELNEIFRDLGNIVHEQGGMIDNIEYNITTIADNTEGADRELVVAHEYQRKAGRRAACLLLIVGFVVAVVLLAVLN